MPSLPRLRSACDACHQLKIKCSGTVPCNTCTDAGQACLYSMSNRRGRPPATDVLQLTNYDIPNTTSIVLLDQPPQSGAAQVPLGQPESARGSRSNTTFPRSQHSRQCFCFERNSSLLCMLKRAGSEEGQVPDTTSGRLMVRIQEALRAWNELSECSSCAHDNDTDVLLLALVCGRELVTQIQAEPGLYDNGPEPGHSPSLVLGNYEVKGDEKSMLLLALRSITIKKLERAILSLQEVLEKKKTLLRARKLASSSHQDRTGSAWDDFAHMDQMMQGIMGYLEILRSAE
ncbi:hypothetical protein F5Y09DRAFT_336304 [Xylaria sp. FL1042]|nr:hypothetical protein F5Y09DRAFT_336304 [Xylaria sp. FL1042]